MRKSCDFGFRSPVSGEVFPSEVCLIYSHAIYWGQDCGILLVVPPRVKFNGSEGGRANMDQIYSPLAKYILSKYFLGNIQNIE